MVYHNSLCQLAFSFFLFLFSYKSKKSGKVILNMVIVPFSYDVLGSETDVQSMRITRAKMIHVTTGKSRRQINDLDGDD